LPLVTTSGGVKFGKTEAGAVWLGPARTAPFRFHPFWLNTDDRDGVRYLKFFPFLSHAGVEALARADAQRPQDREAQRALANAVTATVHGDEQVRRAERAAQVLFGGSFDGVSVADILMVFDDAPSTELTFDADGMPITDLLARVKLAGSKS